MKILVVIPMRRDTGTILDVIDDIKRYAPGVDYLVINGTDEFRVEARLINNKIPHIKTVLRTSHADALSVGIQHAIDKKYDAVIEFSSKKHFDARDIPYFIRTYENSGVSLILGSRYLDKKHKPLRRSKWLRRGIKWISGEGISDAGLRFRLIGKDVMYHFAPGSRWPIGPDIIGYLLRHKVSYKEVQVNADHKTTLEYTKKSESISNTWFEMVSMVFVQRLRKYKRTKRRIANG